MIVPLAPVALPEAFGLMGFDLDIHVENVIYASKVSFVLFIVFNGHEVYGEKLMALLKWPQLVDIFDRNVMVFNFRSESVCREIIG